MAEKPAVVKSAARTLDILECLVRSAKAPTFTKIQEETGIPKSSLSYLLQELLNRDYLRYDPDRRVYYPGLQLVQISASCMNNTTISREIDRAIQGLSAELGETTHAGVLDGRFVVYISKCQGTKDVSMVTNIGFRIPAHVTALGKLLLSALPREEVAARLAGVRLERYTEHSVATVEQLLEELERAAAQGYAVDRQEIIPGGVCVAAPVYDRSGRMVAALSATMPAMRAEGAFFGEMVRKVCAAAAQVSLRIGAL